MSAARSDLMPNIVTIPVGTQAASIVLPGLRMKRHSKIKSVSLINQAALAADNTNFLQVQLQELNGGASVAVVDSRAAQQGALVANTPKDAALAAGSTGVTLDPSGELDVPAGTDLQVSIVKNGTGVPTLAVLQIEWYPA